MSLIHLTTVIQAPLERVFNLSRSIDLHVDSMHRSKEKAINGVTTGLIGLNETVTRQAKHLWKSRLFTSKITAMIPFSFFEDQMIQGDFKKVRHEHHFKPMGERTIMEDFFYFEIPHRFFGKLAVILFLKGYLKKVLQRRNEVIKEYAESSAGDKFL